jgi:thiol:disulfide interchange protein DsbD
MRQSFFLAICVAIFAPITIFAQAGSAKQVSWSFSSKKTGDKQYEVRITATIAGGYHMYAQNAGVEGPLPTTFTFSPNPILVLQGKPTEEGKKITKREDAWDGQVHFYEKTVTFVQTIQGKAKAKTNISGKVEFMVCNDELCLPPAEFSFKIPLGN